MGSTLRKRWPSGLSPVKIFRVLGLPWPADNPPCPQCTTPHPAAVRPDPHGGWWFACPKCTWQGDVFEYFEAATRTTGAEALVVLRARRVRAGAVVSPAALRSYMAHRATRRTLAAFAGAMAGRRLGRVDGQVVTALGLTDRPHHDPLWWCASPAEVEGYTRGTVPADAAARRLGLGTAEEEAGLAAVVIPLADALGRPVGVSAAARVGADGAPEWYYRGLSGDLAGGVGFRPGAAGRVAALGDTGIVATTPAPALAAHRDHTRDHPGTAPVVYVGEWVSSRTTLPSRPWVILYPPWSEADLDAATIVRFARRIGARIAVTGMGVMPYPGGKGYPHRLKAYADTAVRWEVTACDVFRLKADWAATAFLAGIGWSAEVRARVRPHWAAAQLDRADALTRVTTTTARRAVVRPGLVVVEADVGWVDEAGGDVLAAAVPAEVRPYIGTGGRVRHAGTVRFRGKLYPFDTARYRRDAAGVVEYTLLRAGVADAPPPDPRVVPHMAAIGLYFSPGS